MLKIFLTAMLAVFLTGCLTQEPGVQCLNSFKSTLKDPESGKVISFDGITLTYTATNSYGARTQGKAICVKVGDKWVRDGQRELIDILRRTAEKLNESKICKKAGGSEMHCAGDSLALRLSVNSRDGLDVEMLKSEVAKELGY